MAKLYRQHRRTVGKYWKDYNKQKDAGVEDPDHHNKRRGKSGRRGLHLEPLLEALKKIPLKNRTSLSSIAAALDIPPSTLFANLKKLGLRSCSKFVKLKGGGGGLEGDRRHTRVCTRTGIVSVGVTVGDCYDGE